MNDKTFWEQKLEIVHALMEDIASLLAAVPESEAERAEAEAFKIIEACTASNLTERGMMTGWSIMIGGLTVTAAAIQTVIDRTEGKKTVH